MAEQRHTEREVWYEDEDDQWWARCTCSLRFSSNPGGTDEGARMRLAEHIRSVTGWAGRVEEDQHGTKVVTVPEGVMPGVEEIEVPEVTPTPDYSITVTRPPHWQGIVIFDGYGDPVFVDDELDSREIDDLVTGEGIRAVLAVRLKRILDVVDPEKKTKMAARFVQ